MKNQSDRRNQSSQGARQEFAALNPSKDPVPVPPPAQRAAKGPVPVSPPAQRTAKGPVPVPQPVQRPSRGPVPVAPPAASNASSATPVPTKKGIMDYVKKLEREPRILENPRPVPKTKAGS